MVAAPKPAHRKSLGQHHLNHGELCREAVEFLESDGRRVFEIGPGGGVLTRELLRAGADVLAYELDPAWALRLPGSLGPAALRVVVADALDVPWERLDAGDRVAGNLPYQVATSLVERFLVRSKAERGAFLVQLEVAERLVAPPGSRDYGVASVVAAAWSHARIVRRVKPGSFSPPPKVSGGFVTFQRRPPPLPESEMAAFHGTVRSAFSSRRKTVANSLRGRHPRDVVEAALARAGVEGRRRAETLSLEELVAVHEALRALARGGELSRIAPGCDD